MYERTYVRAWVCMCIYAHVIFNNYVFEVTVPTAFIQEKMLYENTF